MKRFAIIFALLSLTALLASAADLTGKWKASFEYNGDAVALTFNFKTDGAALTGSIEGLPTKTTDIKDGKIQDGKVTFWAMIEYDGMPVKLVFNGRPAGDDLQLTMGTEDGGFSVELLAKRAT